MIVDKINAFLTAKGQTIDQGIIDEVSRAAGFAFKRQFEEKGDDAPTLRLSSIGRCIRQQAYKILSFEPNGKEIDSRAKMVFFQGDLAELAIIQLARAAGCAITAFGADQDVVQIDGVKGHPDGLLSENGSKVLVEAKSMSSYGFKDFEQGGLDEGYRYQCNAYMEALGTDRCCIVALNKDAGVLGEMVIEKEAAIVTDIKDRIATLRKATKQDLPYRPYGPDEKTGFLPWNCLYCAYWGHCWPRAEKVLVKGKYKLKTPAEVLV